jgi:hypothetical protein
MSNPNESKNSSRRGKTGMTLVVLAFVLAMLALAADVIWMMPRQPAAGTPKTPATHEQASPASYYALQFSLQTKESGSPATP